jgi:hypothetical protein
MGSVVLGSRDVNQPEEHTVVESLSARRTEKRGTLGRLRDALTKPLPDEARRQHFRIYQIAEMLLKHEDLSFQEILDRVERNSPGFELHEPDLTQKH